MFEARYQNDENGAPAYDPAILLKIILYGYSKGIRYSRRIEQLCRENVVCMALSADIATRGAWASSSRSSVTCATRSD